MSEPLDPHFYNRADAFINLANEQAKETGRGKVSASLMYVTARFNAWISAQASDTADDMQASTDEAIEYFVTQYRAMLKENLADYVENFDDYMKKKPLQ